MTVQAFRADPHRVSEHQDSRNPLATDDKTLGFSSRARWTNSTTFEVFVCTDNTPGAAVWVPATSGVKAYGFAGLNNAGPGAAAVTLTPALVGQKVISIFDVAGTTLDASLLFENSISVTGQIQQTSVSNLSAKHYVVTLG